MFRIVAIVLLLSGPISAAQNTVYQNGVYLDPVNQEKVFSFDRTTIQSETSKIVTVIAKDKTQSVALTEVATYEQGRLISYRSTQHQINASADVTIKRGSLSADKTEITYLTKVVDQSKTSVERRDEPVLSNDEIPDFIRSNIDSLRKGKAVSFYLILPHRRESMEFELSLERPQVVSMRSTSFLVRAFIDPIKFELDQNERPGIKSILGRTPLNRPGEAGGKDLVLNLKISEPI